MWHVPHWKDEGRRMKAEVAEIQAPPSAFILSPLDVARATF
jgi:hypothetical protein